MINLSSCDFLDLHIKFHEHIRHYFSEHNFKEVLCPPISSAPCFEKNVHPLQLYSPKDKRPLPLYFFTSPEFVLKSALYQLYAKYPHLNLYSMGYVLRDDPKSPIHRQQFIMLEWYRSPGDELNLIKDLCALYQFCFNFFQANSYQLAVNNFNPTIMTMQEVFQKHAHFNILDFLKIAELSTYCKENFPNINQPEQYLWEDLFHLIFLNEIEPQLKNYDCLIIKDFPTPLRSIAELRNSDKRVALRFEMYIKGIEIANGYQELCNPQTIHHLINKNLEEKHQTFNYNLEPPQFYLKKLTTSSINQYSGVALGTERLLMSMLNIASGFYDLEN